MRRYAQRLTPRRIRLVLLLADLRRCFSSDRNRVTLANGILYVVGLGMVLLVIIPR